MKTNTLISLLVSRIHPIFFSLGFFCLISCVLAQGTNAPTPIPTRIRVAVDLITVEVYALDSKGNPVPNLKREDFRLYEDGKRQEILSFDSVDGNAVISPSALPIVETGDTLRGKTVLIIFDENTIPPSAVHKMRDFAASFVAEHMQPQDLFGVASWTGLMRILQNLTDDRDAVLAAIAQPSPGHGFGDFEVMLRALEQINYSIASIKGQKSILIFGRPTSMYPRATLSDTYNKTINSARKSNVIYYTVDPGQLGPAALESPTLSIVPGSSDSSNNPVSGMPLIKMPPATYSANSLVSDSGGFSITDREETSLKLDRLGRQISSYYILGFQSSNTKHEGDFRKLRVTTDARAVLLKHKPGYQDWSPIDVLASSKQEQALLTALATPGTSPQLPISFRPAYFYDSSLAARVLIEAEISADKIAYKSKGSHMHADLNIMGAAFAENGSIAARFSETLPISFDKMKENNFRGQALPYRNYFRLRPGKYRLKLAVSDESKNLGSVEKSLEVPALPAQGIACSSLVVAEQASVLPDLIQKLRTQLLDDNDPLLYSGHQIQPSVKNRLLANAPVSVLFRLYNLPASLNQLDLLANAKLLDERGKEFPLAPISLKDKVSLGGNTEAAVYITLPFQQVPPGKYKLVLQINEPLSAQSLTLTAEIELAN